MNHRKVRDNAAKSSIHFAKAEAVSFYHNSREAFLPETSHEELRQKNECDKTAEEARALFEELSAQGDENFLKNCGRRTNMKAENKLWESVMNLRGRHTLEDVQRVNARIQKLTGFIPIQTAIHRDEGHENEKTGDFVLNVHAQTTWLTQDPLTGKSMAYLLFGRKDIYRQIQDIVAEELGMTRGKPAEITGAKHFRNMRDYKQMKRAEGKLNKEWEAKLEANNKAWQEKQAAWEAKLAEREARQAEWERRIPEIMAARRKNEQFLNDKVDWETLKTANRAFMAWHDVSTDILGYPNPNGNLLVEQAKGSLASIFRLFGSVSQLAIFLLTRTEARELKLQNALNVYKVSENLQRAINLVKNDTTNDHVKIVEKIQNIYNNLPHDKRAELIELAILHAPNSEIREDIKALVEGRFSDIAKSEAAQKRIENRDLRAELKEYSEELRKLKNELREMDEENRVLNAAERAILQKRGANRSEYAEQEAQNKARQEEIQKLKDEAKKLKKDLDEARKQQEIDKNTLKEQAAQIKELNEKIEELTDKNAKKQKQLEDAKEEARQTVPQKPKDAFNIIDELEAAEKAKQPEKQREEQKPEPKIEPEPEQKPLKRSDGSEQSEAKPEPELIKKDDNLGIFGYERYVPEPRRHRFGDIEPRKREDDRPKYYEPEPIREPEPEPIFRDPWTEITDEMEKWKKCQSEAEKNLLKNNILQNIEKYEKSGVPPHRQLTLDAYVQTLRPNLAADAEEIRKIRERELERKRQAERETSQKFEDVKAKNVKQEADDTRQTALKKKKKDELEMGIF
nr:hypothetical protein [uncultured Campylobacter sp.]